MSQIHEISRDADRALTNASKELANIRTGEWLTTNQVGRMLQISPSSLEKARCTGDGPWARLPYRKIGRSVRYARADVIAFLNENTVQGRSPKSPSDTEVGR